MSQNCSCVIVELWRLLHAAILAWIRYKYWNQQWIILVCRPIPYFEKKSSNRYYKVFFLIINVIVWETFIFGSITDNKMRPWFRFPKQKPGFRLTKCSIDLGEKDFSSYVIMTRPGGLLPSFSICSLYVAFCIPVSLMFDFQVANSM